MNRSYLVSFFFYVMTLMFFILILAGHISDRKKNNHNALIHVEVIKTPHYVPGLCYKRSQI